MRDIKAGEKINPEDIKILRTEKILTPGCSPEFLDLITGKIITRNVKNGEGVQLEDFMKNN